MSAELETTTKEESEMKKGRFSTEQIHRCAESARSRTQGPELAREISVSEATIYSWKAKYGAMDVSEAQHLKSLEDERQRAEETADGFEPGQ